MTPSRAYVCYTQLAVSSGRTASATTMEPGPAFVAVLLVLAAIAFMVLSCLSIARERMHLSSPAGVLAGIKYEPV